MIKISRKADYAIFLLTCLARTGRLMSAAELTGLSGKSRFLVANLLKDCTKAGVLESVRGANGGYRLARAAKDISLREILEVVEGPLQFVSCADSETGAPEKAENAPPDPALCNLMQVCPAMGPMAVLHNRIIELLESLALSELASHRSLAVARKVAGA
ncbi:MAG: RrF2 family transcriptional regulator [Planctomycetota bacterium]